MKTRSILVLWSIAIILGISIFFLKTAQDSENRTATLRSPGETLLPDFPAKDISMIEISSPESTATLNKKGNRWLISQRVGYPANVQEVNDLLRTFSALKVTQSIEAGPEFASRFGLVEKSSDPSEQGITATFKDSSGKELSKIIVGNNLEASSSSGLGAGVTGRFIRNDSDKSGFYAVSEIFPTLSPDPKDWLSTEFLQIEKIQSISVTKPGSDEIEWRVSRNDESEELLLGEAHLGTKTNLSAVNPLKILFAFTQYEDILIEAEAAKSTSSGQTVKCTINTFEGFTYQLTLRPQSSESTSYLMTIKVDAKLPKVRKRQPGETKETAVELETYFTERLEILTDRLDQTKALEGFTFVVNQDTAAPLLLPKSALIQQTPAPQPTPPVGP